MFSRCGTLVAHPQSDNLEKLHSRQNSTVFIFDEFPGRKVKVLTTMKLSTYSSFTKCLWRFHVGYSLSITFCRHLKRILSPQVANYLIYIYIELTIGDLNIMQDAEV